MHPCVCICVNYSENPYFLNENYLGKMPEAPISLIKGFISHSPENPIF